MHDNTNIYWVSVKPRLRHFLASATFFMQVKILRLYWAMVMILAAWSALDTSSSVLDSSLRILPRHAVNPGSTWPSTCQSRVEQSRAVEIAQSFTTMEKVPTRALSLLC